MQKQKGGDVRGLHVCVAGEINEEGEESSSKTCTGRKVLL